jgi:DNA polymerase III delta prime subunit
MSEREMFVWTEKYRPKKIEDCILTDELRRVFNDVVENKNLPGFIFSGPAGVGKTTVAKALCSELGIDWIMINGSEESGIDILRTKIKNFASTVSFGDGDFKVVILDEADFLNPQSTQPALRGFMEEFAGNCRFIMTCNFKNKILDALRSRCSEVDFQFKNKDKQEIAAGLFARVKYILKTEQVKHDDKVVVELIKKHFPDMRRVLNELQKYSLNGEIDSGILAEVGEVSIKVLVKFLKEKKWNEARKWVVQNLDNDPIKIYREIYDTMEDHITPASQPNLVLIIAKYEYESAFVADQEINLVAALTEIMLRCEFK